MEYQMGGMPETGEIVWWRFQSNGGHGVVLKEDLDVMDQLRMRCHKVLIGSSYIIRIGGSSVLEKHLQWIQLYACGFRCIRKAVSDVRKGHLRLLEVFLQNCDWFWDRKTGGISTGRVAWYIMWSWDRLLQWGVRWEQRWKAWGISNGIVVIWFRM